MIKRILIILTIAWCCAPAWAQRHVVFSNDIGSLQVVAGKKWQEMPVINLNSGEHITISFDEMSHEYHRYTYDVVHLEKDWTESTGLLTADYIAGFQSGIAIEDYEESINTTQNYTHYSLQIPNRECQLKMSGNYRVDIIDDESQEKVISAFFLVNEDLINVGLSASGDTDIDTRRSHQQVNVKIDYAPLRTIYPREQITGYVLQNYRWDSMVALPASTGINQQYMEWTHCRDLIFDGGNEYHKFEILDVHRNSFNVEDNVWDRENNVWHTYLWPDYKRPSYVYDETPKGAFYIRNSDNRESDITSEYVRVHFILQSQEPFPYPVYVNGMWTNEYNDDRYEMKYDNGSKTYTVEVPLKYGYYSYQYLMSGPDGKTMIPPTEGSYYETRNVYTALFYYRSNIDRADRLVGIGKLKL